MLQTPAHQPADAPAPGSPAAALRDDLAAAARNLVFGWHPDLLDLFAELDPALWERLRHNPVALVEEAPAAAFERAAADAAYVARLAAARAAVSEELTSRTWWERELWRGHGSLAAFANAITGSSALYAPGGRGPRASVNFVTAHDGLTLADLVAYEQKHNEANLEDNRDGTSFNRSWNCGVEGPTDDPEIVALRARQQRNLLASLLLSQGVPMLVAGDERCRSQGGNNNAWCQDNPTSWLSWEADQAAAELQAFTRRLIALRQAHPVFRRTTFLDGHGPEEELPDAWWFRHDGLAMAPADWHDPGRHAVGLFLHGEKSGVEDARGRPLDDESFLLLLNAGAEPVAFTLPREHLGLEWTLELSTADPGAGAGHGAAGPGFVGEAGPGPWGPAARVDAGGRCLLLLRRTR